MTSYYDPDDPWSAFDPEAAQVLKEVFQREFESRLQPFNDAEADRQLAKAEERMKAIYGKSYEKNREAILRFAVDNNMPDLDLAFRAFRGTAQIPASETDTRPAATQADRDPDAVPAADSLLEGERLNRVSKRRAFELDAKEQELVRELQRANAAERRQEQLRNVNQEHNIRNRQRTERTELGHFEENPRARTTSREEMDAVAEDALREANASTT